MPSRPIKHIKPILLVFVLLLVACGQQNRQVQTTDTVVDDYGRTVVIPAQPQRVFLPSEHKIC